LTLAPKSRRCPAAKLLVHDKDEFLPGGEIASSPSTE
jgi:hypothetical protein